MYIVLQVHHVSDSPYHIFSCHSFISSIFSVLLFPPVNSYRRFLIHKVSETVTANQSNALSTFSIGTGDRRRTVICRRYQLLVDINKVSLQRLVLGTWLLSSVNVVAFEEESLSQLTPYVVYATLEPISCSAILRQLLIFTIVSIMHQLFSVGSWASHLINVSPFRFRSEEAEFTWRYLERNSVPKKEVNNRRTHRDMGVENAPQAIESNCKHRHITSRHSMGHDPRILIMAF